MMGFHPEVEISEQLWLPKRPNKSRLVGLVSDLEGTINGIIRVRVLVLLKKSGCSIVARRNGIRTIQSQIRAKRATRIAMVCIRVSDASHISFITKSYSDIIGYKCVFCDLLDELFAIQVS